MIKGESYMKFNITDFTAEIICDGVTADTKIEVEARENEFDLYLTANTDRPRFVSIKWKGEPSAEAKILGDTWERSYADLQFLSLAENNRPMPWYFIAAEENECFCMGVKTGCNSFVSFSYTEKGISALIDVRNGGNGVHLDGRRICLATFICELYNTGDAIECLRAFCKKMCPPRPALERT
jgi:alpha-galactosidase